MDKKVQADYVHSGNATMVGVTLSGDSEFGVPSKDMHNSIHLGHNWNYWDGYYPFPHTHCLQPVPHGLQGTTRAWPSYRQR